MYEAIGDKTVDILVKVDKIINAGIPLEVLNEQNFFSAERLDPSTLGYQVVSLFVEAVKIFNVEDFEQVICALRATKNSVLNNYSTAFYEGEDLPENLGWQVEYYDFFIRSLNSLKVIVTGLAKEKRFANKAS